MTHLSKKTADRRRVFTGIDATGTFPVEYRFTYAPNGARHLLVIFANYTAPDDYGWSKGILDNLRTNILWIRDRFDGEHSYYLCKGMDFALEESVARLIGTVLRALGIGPESCTAFGSSKGGSAALYFGLRYGYANIVASVPQFRIGSYVAEGRPQTARYMMGESPDAEHVRILDEILPGLVRARSNHTANLYLVSSSRDEQFSEQIEPFLGLLQQYENFNFVANESPLIDGHGQVSMRSVPHLLSLLSMLADGMAPRLGHVIAGREQPDSPRSDMDAYLSATSLVKKENEFPPPTVSAPAAYEEVEGAASLEGTARGAVRVSLWENGKFLATPGVALDGTWSWRPKNGWDLGGHTLRIFGVDAAGFQSARTDFSFSVANRRAALTNRLPAPLVSLPAPYQQVAATAVSFTGAAPGAAHVELHENGVFLGSCVVGPDGTWVWYAGWAWSTGTHLVEISAMDARGIGSAVLSLPITVVGRVAGHGS